MLWDHERSKLGKVSESSLLVFIGPSFNSKMNSNWSSVELLVMDREYGEPLSSLSPKMEGNLQVGVHIQMWV